jgi:hypothetical protein
MLDIMSHMRGGRVFIFCRMVDTAAKSMIFLATTSRRMDSTCLWESELLHTSHAALLLGFENLTITSISFSKWKACSGGLTLGQWHFCELSEFSGGSNVRIPIQKEVLTSVADIFETSKKDEN